MQKLFEAIYTKATAAGNFNTAVGGRVYIDHAPQNPTFPYCVYWMVDDTNDTQFLEEYPRVMIQFDLFDTSASAATINTLQGYLLAVFNNLTTLSVTGYTFIGMAKDFDVIDWDPEEKRWQYVTQFTIQLQKS